MSRRVLCIAGSPRRGGNSDRMLDALGAGVEAAGGTADRLVVAEAGIAPCRGCNACATAGVCVVRDGMADVYPRIDAANAIAVSSPVYFATVPAVLKAFYDRCQPYWARRYLLGQPRPVRRPGALLLVGGGGDPFGTACAVTPTRSVLGVLGVELVHLLEATADRPREIETSPELLERAEEIGELLAGTGPSTSL